MPRAPRGRGRVQRVVDLALTRDVEELDLRARRRVDRTEPRYFSRHRVDGTARQLGDTARGEDQHGVEAIGQRAAQPIDGGTHLREQLLATRRFETRVIAVRGEELEPLVPRVPSLPRIRADLQRA